jgi:hypothetical protein
MKGSTRMRRRVGVTALALSGMVSAMVVPSSPAEAFTKPPQAYGGYSSGVETFVNLAPGAQLAKAQVAIGRSAANSQGLTNITDELGNTVSNADPNLAARGFGEALELNVVGQPVQLVAPALATAPPSSFSGPNTLLNLPVSNLASVQAVRGYASARFNDDGNVCIIGADMALGVGEAADARLLGTGSGPLGLTGPAIATQTGGNNPVSTNSRQLLTGQVREDGSVAGTKLGVLSEVIQTVVPVSIADPSGTVAISVEVAGVFRLRAFAGGLPGTAFVEYNPETGSQAPVIRLTFPPAGPLGGLLGGLLSALPADVQALINFNPATGALLIPLGPILDLLGPLVDLLASLGIVIGEQPRAINGLGAPVEAANGTTSAGAIDLVRIRPAGAIAGLAGLVGDVRVGHMEVQAFAPAGGIDCPGLGVGKVTDRDPVQVGEAFVYTITATNPYDCILTNVRVQDDILASSGIGFTINGTDPAATSITDLANGGKRVVFDDIGPIPPRGTGAVRIQITVDSATGNGRISDTATVTADCATGGGTGSTNVNFNLGGSVTLNAPQVGGSSVGGDLARTGREDGAFLLLGFALLMAMSSVEVLRRRSRSHR